jgi:hypothetical protein
MCALVKNFPFKNLILTYHKILSYESDYSTDTTKVVLWIYEDTMTVIVDGVDLTRKEIYPLLKTSKKIIVGNGVEQETAYYSDATNL